ncbi:MAG: hypothetical protein UX86_C0029G0023, partial [Candidatus Amesbacteria bacterium GW2011_GWC1_47_15]
PRGERQDDEGNKTTTGSKEGNSFSTSKL